MDVLDGALSPEEIMRLDLPLVMDLVKAKTRLEESKGKARRAAQEMQKMEKKGGGMF
jgi:hypothetical protein